MTCRRFYFSPLAMALLIVATGCDSNVDDENVAANCISSRDADESSDFFVGTWVATEIRDATGDQSASFAESVSLFTVTFSPNSYGMRIVFNDQRDPIFFNGATYSINEASNTITIVIPAVATGTADLPLTFDYTFSENNNAVELCNGTQVLPVNLLFGTTYEAPVTVTLVKSEASLFVDAWAAVGVTDASGDQTQSFAQSVSEFVMTFQNNSTYSLSVVFTDDRQSIQFSGATYSVDEDLERITIVIPAAATGTVDLPLVFGYTFSNSNNTVALTNSAQVGAIGLIFGASYQAPVTLTLQRQ